jgi:hypothetical protein
MSTDAPRTWIKVGDDPLRYEYGRENSDSMGPPITGQLAYVERERSGYFKWETYTDPHEEGAEPSRTEAQERALKELEQKGRLPADGT